MGTKKESQIQRWHGERVKRIAIPYFGADVAPCFEAAHRFRCWQFDGQEIIEYCELEVDEQPDGLMRIRLLERQKINVLLCNGIGQDFRQMLAAKGCKVVQGMVGTVVDTLDRYLAEKIYNNGQELHLQPSPSQQKNADLVEWTVELFRSLGWDAQRETRPEAFPVDIVAKKNCPLCIKPVCVAVSCGAHVYRMDEEIREFQRVTANGYNCRVYIYQLLPGVAKACRDYDIQLIDSNAFSSWNQEKKTQWLMPPLEGNVIGHEKLSLTNRHLTAQAEKGNP